MNAIRVRSEHSPFVMWLIVVVAVVVVLLGAAAWIDRDARRRGARIVNGGDIARQTREADRDARVIDNALIARRDRTYDWTSWSRRNRSGQ